MAQVLAMTRNLLLILAGAWAVALPFAVSNVEHFGWGFYPAVASLCLVPAFFVLLAADAIFARILQRRAAVAQAKLSAPDIAARALLAIYAVYLALGLRWLI